MNASFIEPNNLRQWWGFVRPGLLKILEKSPEPWIPEDVYADCYSGKSMLWIAQVDARPVGFAVLQPQGTTLHVWCVHLESGHLDTGWQHLLEIARSGGAERITFDSWRPGWEKQARKLGFKPRRWAMEVV
jgi:hypothetical protein